MTDYGHVLGIHELDALLGPSLPPGWLAFLTGSSGSGAPLLAKQFASAGTGSSPVLFYTTYERSEDVRDAFDEFGWDSGAVQIVNLADEYYRRVLVRGLEIARVRERGLSIAELSTPVADASKPTSFNLVNRMLSDLASIDTPFRLVLDSLDFFFEVLGPRDVTTVARQIRYRCQTLGGQALLCLHTAHTERMTVGLLQDVADIVVDLHAEPHGNSFLHWLKIEKVGNHPDLARILKAQVTSSGWTVNDVAPPR